MAAMFKGASQFDRWRVFLRAFRYQRRPSVSRWRAVVLAAARLSAFIIICELALDLLPAGTRALNADHGSDTRLRSPPSVSALVPRSILLVPACANVSVLCQIQSPCLFDVRQITRQKVAGSLSTYDSSARVPPAPQKRCLIGH